MILVEKLQILVDPIGFIEKFSIGRLGYFLSLCDVVFLFKLSGITNL
jgi:hypothetical protein